MDILSLSNNTNLSTFVNNYKINYNGTEITTSVLVNSYFTDSEKQTIDSFLKGTYKYKSHYYDTLKELHLIESFLITKIKELILSEYFWENINESIKTPLLRIIKQRIIGYFIMVH